MENALIILTISMRLITTQLLMPKLKDERKILTITYKNKIKCILNL